MGVNAWAELVTVTMLGFGQELVQTAPSRLRYAPREQAGAVLAAATGSAVTTADYTDEQVGMPVVEARRTAANDEAWGVHVLVTAPGVAAQPTQPGGVGGEDGCRVQVAELLGVVHDRAGTTAAAAVVIDEHSRGEGFPGATVAHLDASGTLTRAGVGLTVQATGWDEETSRGVGMLMAHLTQRARRAGARCPRRSALASADRQCRRVAGRPGPASSTPTVHDSSRAAVRPRRRWPTRFTWKRRHHQRGPADLAPTVPADVLELVMAADPTLDADVAAWFDPDSGRTKLAVLGPVTLTTTQPHPSGRVLRRAGHLPGLPGPGATAEQIRTSFGLSARTTRAYLSTLREHLGKDPLTGAEYLAGAKDSAAGKARGVGIYQIAACSWTPTCSAG